jgi:hypothetical protein
MRMNPWQAVAPLLGVLLFLSISLPPVTGEGAADKEKPKATEKDDCIPGGGCVGYVCPVTLYAVYPEYCSYDAQYCTGSATILYNVSIDDVCGHTLLPPWCCEGQCAPPTWDCILIPDYKGKKPPLPPDTYQSAPKLRKGLMNRGKLNDPKLANPVPPRPTATLVGRRVLVELETQKGKTYARVLLYKVDVDPTKETDPKKLAAVTLLKMKKMTFGTGLEVEKTTDPADPISYDGTGDYLRHTKEQVCCVHYKGMDYQVILHKDTKVDPKTKKAARDKK